MQPATPVSSLRAWRPLFAALCMMVLLCGTALWANGLAAGRLMVLAGAMLFGWLACMKLTQHFSAARQTGVATGERLVRHGMIALIVAGSFLLLALCASVVYVRAWVLPALAATQKPIAWRGGLLDSVAVLNTLALLTVVSGILGARWALRRQQRRTGIAVLALALVLGVASLALQGYAFLHGYYVEGVSLSAGIYGSLFYGIMGWHALIVLVGTLILAVVFVRACLRPATAGGSAELDAVLWYWLFVAAAWFLIQACFRF